MATEYNYKARKPQGELIKGTMQAASRLDVADYIQRSGYYVVSIEEKRDLSLKDLAKFMNRIKIKELSVLSRQFAVLIQAGVPIIQCLDILTNQIENKNLKRVMQEIYKDVEVGMSFSEALEKHEDVFPQFYSRMINAGEVGGILDTVMNRLADHYERENELVTKVRSAMIYPVAVLILALLIMTGLLIFVVPVFAKLFSSMGGKLPAPTLFVIGVSHFFVNYWYLLIILGLVVAIGTTSYLKTPNGRLRFHSFQLRVPILGKLIVKSEVTRICRTLGSLVKSGVPLMEALRVVERIISNQVIADTMIDARLKVREGVRLSEPLQESGKFPRIMTQMLVVGEETGTMDEMLEKIAHFYDQETENALEAAVSMLEPIMIIFVAVIVAVIVISIIMPMFDMVNLV